MLRDSVEIDELKHPLQVGFLRIVPGTGGAGRHRGAPAMEMSYGPTRSSMEVLWPCDGTVYPPRGVRGFGLAVARQLALDDHARRALPPRARRHERRPPGAVEEAAKRRGEKDGG